MTIKTRTRVLSAETRTSRKSGNSYMLLNFMDGAQVVNAMVDNEAIPMAQQITPFNEYELVIDFNFRYGSARVTHIKAVQ